MAEFNKYIKHKNLDYTSCSSLPAEADSAEGEEDEPSNESFAPKSSDNKQKLFVFVSRVPSLVICPLFPLPFVFRC